MNERIKELAKQCYEIGPIGKDGWPDYCKFNEEKFAVLIVRECAKRVDYWESRQGEHSDDLLKHFGVEE
jgi:hypothetical protein